jgi:hypothetical protein
VAAGKVPNPLLGAAATNVREENIWHSLSEESLRHVKHDSATRLPAAPLLAQPIEFDMFVHGTI